MATWLAYVLIVADCYGLNQTATKVGLGYFLIWSAHFLLNQVFWNKNENKFCASKRKTKALMTRTDNVYPNTNCYLESMRDVSQVIVLNSFESTSEPRINFSFLFYFLKKFWTKSKLCFDCV